MTYHYLKELYKYQEPKAVVLDLYAPARFKEDYQYDWISENIYGMRFSFNKLQMLSVSVEPTRLFQYFPSFLVYHDRYDDLEKEDFEHFWWDEEEKEAELILIAASYAATEEEQSVYNRIAEIAEEKEVSFINYNEYYEEIGFDFEQDFNDESHLNYWGSCKFTDYM